MRGANVRGGAPGRRPHAGPQMPPIGGPPGADKPKREAILDLSKYVDERIRVKFTGGREGVQEVILHVVSEPETCPK